MSQHSDWEIEIVSDWNEIYSVKFQLKWQEYIEGAFHPNVFFHPSLCMPWIETYRPLRNMKPVFSVARRNDTTVFLPLVLWRQNWKNAFRKLLVPVGYSDFDYHDPITSARMGTEEWASFYSALFIRLREKLKFDEIDINGLRSELPISDYFSAEEEVSPYFDLTSFSGEKDLLENLKGSLRGDLLRQIRRINSRGELSLYRIRTIDEALDLLPRLMELHSSRWPSSYKAPFFHENLIKKGIESGITDFTALKSGDDFLSYNIGFNFNDIYYYYMPAIDPIFENLSPGKVHLFLLIRSSVENRFMGFDHLRGDENYKTDWSNHISQLYRVHSVSRNPVSGLKHFLVASKSRIR